MRNVLILAGAILLVARPAFAADLPVYNWTGFYIGGNLGGVTNNAAGTSDFLDTGASSPFFQTNPQFNSFSETGFLGGIQAGYNRQFNQWGVVGIEGDWDWGRTRYSFCRQTNVLADPCDDNHQGFETIESKLNWLATIRGRFGFFVTDDSGSAPRVLVYGTGGGALGGIETTLSQSCMVGCGPSSNVPVATSQTTTNIKGGWVAGAGIEAMLTDHWLLGGEWLHADLGRLSNALTTVGSSGTQTTTWSRTEKFDEFRATLSYKF
jgi:outer membrane immunogenic protein